MAFNDYREPIEVVIDRYFQMKKFHETNSPSSEKVSLGGGFLPSDELPESPCTIMRNDEGLVRKFIYGDESLIDSDEECSPVIWQEELIRNAKGLVEQIITTYPDGSTDVQELVRDGQGRLVKHQYL